MQASRSLLSAGYLLEESKGRLHSGELVQKGSRPPRAGRCDPFRAPDTDPSLQSRLRLRLGRAPGEFALQGSRGPQNGGLGRSKQSLRWPVLQPTMASVKLRALDARNLAGVDGRHADLYSSVH